MAAFTPGLLPISQFSAAEWSPGRSPQCPSPHLLPTWPALRLPVSAGSAGTGAEAEAGVGPREEG